MEVALGKAALGDLRDPCQHLVLRGAITVGLDDQPTAAHVYLDRDAGVKAGTLEPGPAQEQLGSARRTSSCPWMSRSELHTVSLRIAGLRAPFRVKSRDMESCAGAGTGIECVLTMSAISWIVAVARRRTVLERRLVPLCGLGAGLPELGTPRRSAAVKAAAAAALASTGREARAEAFTARTAWDNGTRGKPAPRLDVRRLSRRFCGTDGPTVEKTAA
jgi:hypothetical protein